jgi:hypothetical protein
MEHDFGICEILDQPVDAIALDGVIELLCNTIDIHGE